MCGWDRLLNVLWLTLKVVVELNLTLAVGLGFRTPNPVSQNWGFSAGFPFFQKNPGGGLP